MLLWFEFLPDGTLLVLGQDDNSLKRFAITPSSETSQATIGGGSAVTAKVMMKRNLFTNALFGALASVSVSAQQPPALQLNVPYSCPGNTSVLVNHCANSKE